MSSSRENHSPIKHTVSTKEFTEQVDSWIEDLNREADQIYSMRMKTAMMEDRLAMIVDLPQQGDEMEEEGIDSECDDPFAVELMASTSVSANDEEQTQDKKTKDHEDNMMEQEEEKQEEGYAPTERPAASSVSLNSHPVSVSPAKHGLDTIMEDSSSSTEIQQEEQEQPMDMDVEIMKEIIKH